MSILKVARMGHPILKQVADVVPTDFFGTSQFQQLVEDMVETMEEYSGAGLAAPQVHESWQISVIEVKDNPRYPKANEIPLLVLVNPVITPLTTEKKLGWEGCLSLPGLRGAVPRFTKIHVKAQDQNGDPLDFVADGFKAIVIQHETDHLFGTVFIERMENMKLLYFEREWDRYSEQLPQIPVID
ncbi:MAG: peptide deformylase [Bacteroidetes bacterium]|nr:peptide deformylase [Bacteroidota bacterium]